MRPTETLSREHSLVMLVTKAAEQEVRYMRDTGAYRAEAVDELLDFFEFFTEACHDPKEERLLFARLCDRGLSSETGVLAQFYREHAEFRTRLHDLEHWVRAEKKNPGQDLNDFALQLDDYLQMMRAHLAREEEILFPMADGLLTDDDQDELERGFADAECEEADVGVRDRYADLAHMLLGRPTETLQKEHKICYLVLDAAEREIEAVKAGGPFDAEEAEQLVDFFRSFTRKCHEPKEARLLYSKLAQRGLSRDEGVLAEMIRDHEELSQRMQALERDLPKTREGAHKAVAAFVSDLDA